MNRKNFKFVYNYLKHYKFLWLLGVTLTALAMVIKIKYSWLMKDLIDNALIPQNFSLLLQLTILFPVLVLTCSLLNYLKEYCFSYVSQKSILKMREDIFTHVLKLPYCFFIKNSSGEIINRLINDVEITQEAFSDSIVTFISSLISILFVSVWLFFINWELAIIVLMVVPLFVIITKILWKKISELSRQSSEERGEVTSFLQQTITSIELVKLSGSNSDFFVKTLKILCATLSSSIIKLRMNRIFANTLWESILTPYQAIIYFIGGYWYMTKGSPTIGTMLAFINYVNILIPSMLDLISAFTNMARGISSLNRVQEYLEEKPQKSGKRLLSKESEIIIEFKNVNFKYPSSEFEISDLNLSIDNNEFVTIVGTTGSGKSTLVKLLVRLFDVDNGQILINGINIEEYDLLDLRNCFGFVQQDVYLLKGSIRDNLIFSNKSIAQDKIEQAISIAQLESLIASLPNQIDSIISERGTTLSGGEKQRLSIARMILRHSKIIILDEPTAALDLETENRILNNMKPLFNQTTTIAIDHRLATVSIAKKIIVMSKGKIVEYGSYKELIKQNGEFCKLLNLKSL